MSALIGTLHHLEINASDLRRSAAVWKWLLGALGYVPFEQWSDGMSWRLGDSYIVLTQTPEDHAIVHYHRRATGLNHVAFHAASRQQVDELTGEVKRRGLKVLYEERHPYAGGAMHYALFFEDPDGIKIEVVAPA